MNSYQWVTWSGGRSKEVGQDNYQLWEVREELEYGVTDNYSISLYLNGQNESYWMPDNGNGFSKFTFTGVSLENRYMVLDPVEHGVGLTLYVESRFSGTEAELEEKVILGQRYGDWKWAVNITHATEWSGHFHGTEGEFEVSMGLSRDLGKHWSVGLELRDHNELPDYNQWENTALYLRGEFSRQPRRQLVAGVGGARENQHSLAIRNQLLMRITVAGLALWFGLFAACQNPGAAGNNGAFVVPPASGGLAVARKLYMTKCSRCHKLYDPRKYDDAEWSDWMTKMSHKAKLKPGQPEMIADYVEKALRNPARQ